MIHKAEDAGPWLFFERREEMAIIMLIVGLVVGAAAGGFGLIVYIASAMDKHEED